MNRLDLIIEAIRLAEYHVIAKDWGDDADLELYTEALVAARELRDLKLVAKHVCNLWINPETSEYEVDRCTHPRNEVIPVYTALAQPEQDGFAPYTGKGEESKIKHSLEPKPEQEPVAWLVSDAQGRYATIRDPAPYGEEVYEPLYAAPPSKQWVGLTDEERCTFVSLLDNKTVNEIFNAIEAALRSKNT